VVAATAVRVTVITTSMGMTMVSAAV